MNIKLKCGIANRLLNTTYRMKEVKLIIALLFFTQTLFAQKISSESINNYASIDNNKSSTNP